MTATESLGGLFDRWEFVLAAGTFEESLTALEQIVARLEEGKLSLDDALRCYELGVLMSRRCEKMLDEAELRISRLDEQAIETELDDPTEEAPF